MKLPLQHADIDYMPRVRMDEYRANVDEIVRRVNAHDALVAALRLVLEKTNVQFDNPPDMSDLLDDIGECRETVNAALKAAGETS